MYWTNAPQAYLGLGVLLLGFLGLAIRRALNCPLADIPGPWYTRWTDAVLTYHWLSGRRFAYIHDLHQKYGPVVRIAPYHADITDTSAKKQIYNVKEAYTKSSWYQAISPPGTVSLFNTSDVEFHRRHRRLLSSGMTEANIRTLEPGIMWKVDLCVQRMREEMGRRGATDVFKWFMFLATDVIAELSFGEGFHMLEQGKKNAYIENMERLAKAQSVRPHFPWLLALALRVKIPFFSNMTKVGPETRMYARQKLAAYREKVAEDPYGANPSLFKKMLVAQDEDRLTFEEILSDGSLYISAGSDTTSNTLSYLVWAVTKDLKIRDRLVKELGTLEEDFGGEEVRDMPYLNMVIEEALRLYAPISGPLPRVVPAGGATLAGYHFPAGATASCQAYSLHRDPAVFPDPERFDPDRWAKPTKEMRDAFHAWGGGSRICIGMHLARLELRLATAKFFRTFPNALPTSLQGMSDADMEPDAYFLSNPKGKRCLIKTL